MKPRIFAVTIVVALASRTALSASEGGDTWSAVQPIEQANEAASQSVRPPAAPATQETVSGASEGGDTWSELRSLPGERSFYLPTVATTANLSTLRRELPSVYGTPIQDGSVARVLHLDPKVRWLNVNYGETIRFVSTEDNSPERSFEWRFDVSPNIGNVDLNNVAPSDFPNRDVRVFVSPNPLYRGG